MVTGVSPKVHYDDFTRERAKPVVFDVNPVGGFDVRGGQTGSGAGTRALGSG